MYHLDTNSQLYWITINKNFHYYDELYEQSIENSTCNWYNISSDISWRHFTIFEISISLFHDCNRVFLFFSLENPILTCCKVPTHKNIIAFLLLNPIRSLATVPVLYTINMHQAIHRRHKSITASFAKLQRRVEPTATKIRWRGA